MPDLTDDDLMRMFRDGDQEAFDVLFDRHYAIVHNFAYQMLRQAQRAQDVLQETFLTVIREAARYEGRGHFRTWLLRICRNRCLHQLEAERARRQVSAEAGFELLEVPAPEPTAPERLVADERLQLVRGALAGLPERQREALVLYAFEHLEYREIAAVLDVPVNTIKTLIYRARAALAAALEQAGEPT